MTTPLQESDKVFWHRFIDFYEPRLAALGAVSTILEFGVFKGDSIRWLTHRFPGAQVVGCDIVPQQTEWPVAPNIGYVRIDQESVAQIRKLFEHFKIQFDLVIEDGSHKPVHQRNCLVEALPWVRPGGMYVLEDIHTAHPRHALYREMGQDAMVGPLHLLLALEHATANGKKHDAALRTQLSTNSLFSREDVDLIFSRVTSVEFYRRAALPHRCWQCGTSAFDFATLRCQCGTSLYEEADSMSAVVRL